MEPCLAKHLNTSNKCPICRQAIVITRGNAPKVNKQLEQVITHLQQTQREKDDDGAQQSRTAAVVKEVPSKQGKKRKRSGDPEAPANLSIIQRMTRLETTLLGEAKVGAIMPRLVALEQDMFGSECDHKASIPLDRILAMEEKFLGLHR